jgi:hypothetical protein
MTGLDRNTEGKIKIRDLKVLRRKWIVEVVIYIYIYIYIYYRYIDVALATEV